MQDHLDEPESTKTAGPNTPPKPRAHVGQPGTPSTANSKKTRTTIFISSAQADAGKTAAQRCELAFEQVSADTDIMDKTKSSPLRMKEQGLVKVILDCKDSNDAMATLRDDVHVAKAGFEGAATVFVLPKTANAGSLIHEWQASVALFNHVARTLHVASSSSVWSLEQR